MNGEDSCRLCIKNVEMIIKSYQNLNTVYPFFMIVELCLFCNILSRKYESQHRISIYQNLKKIHVWFLEQLSLAPPYLVIYYITYFIL